jgi:hypothetical protein
MPGWFGGVVAVAPVEVEQQSAVEAVQAKDREDDHVEANDGDFHA